MDHFPDPDEEYELLYQEELKLLDNIQNTEGNLSLQKDVEFAAEKKGRDFSKSLNTNQTTFAKRLFGSHGSEKTYRKCSTPTTSNKKRDLIEVITPFTPIPTVDTVHSEIQELGKRNKRRLEKDFVRHIDGLYGNEFYQDPVAKKARSEEERDLEEIEKILAARKHNKDNSQFQRKVNFSRLQEIHDFKMKNLSYTIPSWPFLVLLRSDGQRIYCRYHSKEYEERAINDIVLSNKFSGLLGEKKQEIWMAANDIVFKRLMCKSQLEDSENETFDGVTIPENFTELWVEKYKPKKYIDLLSDENTNRNILCWLKMWDKIVFGREFQMNSRELNFNKVNSFNKRTGKFEPSSFWQKQRARGMLDTKVDDLGRPIQKIALLCGPPGLGKTTLAHTIASHAGYEVREVNASDDRSPEAFKLALENGTEMQSVFNENKRPNCIVLDEVDGAPKQSIDFLIKFATDNFTGQVPSKTTKVKRNVLKRPIICICNDLYDPALRPLRQIAFVVMVPQIDSSRLAERLLQIAKQEKLRTDFGALIALAEKSGNDVRSCISTMQFFNAQKKAFTLQDVLNSNLGQKDRHQGLFDVWSSVFRIQRPKKHLVSLENSETGFEICMTDTSTSRRVQNVLDVIHSSGDYERLMQGVYENYAHQKMPDPNMNGVVEAMQWFTFTDMLNFQISHIQNYAIYPYLQYGFVVWHLLFATLAWPKINFPTKNYEFNQKSGTLKSIFQAFRKGIKSEISGIGQGIYLLTETLPFLKVIMSLQMRSVDIQLLSKSEKENLRHCVEIMVDLGLTYTQTKTVDGNYEYRLEPGIEMLSEFSGFISTKITHISKQLIAREVELENIRRLRPKISNGSNQSLLKKHKNHLQTLKPKGIVTEIKELVTKDFFGRVKDKSVNSGKIEAIVSDKTDPIVKSPVWFRYKEGFNNAVRKDLHLNQLL